MKDSLKKVVSLLTSLALIAAVVLVWWQHWAIYDWWRLRGYQPPAAIAQIAADTTMKPSTQHLFYVYHPDLEDKQTFSQNCKSDEKTIILGCYVAFKGIYLSNIQDPRLSGILQVTAAHETLHAAYDRLSPSEKQRVNKLIDQAYAGLQDDRIKNTVEEYQKSGADVTNELHSILGTEVRNLPPELETYYGRYFSDRSKIVSYSENYEKAFTDRKNKVAEDDRELASIKQQIDSLEASLNAQQKVIDAKRAQLDAYLAAKDYKDYNAGVNDYNAQVASYNQNVNRIKSLISQYNSLLEERNALALEENQLINAIQNTPETIQQQ